MTILMSVTLPLKLKGMRGIRIFLNHWLISEDQVLRDIENK